MQESLLSIKKLNISFQVDDGRFKAVKNIDLDISKGETLGLVGESGSGKSVTAFSIVGLLPENSCQVSADAIEFDGNDLSSISFDKIRKIRGNDIGIVFQDALSSLDPVFTIGSQLAETIKAHNNVDKQQIKEISIDILEKVGIPDAATRLKDYPHQLSGGMRQRVMIAIALVNKPKFLIADEPTTSLDVTIQAQILELIKESKKNEDMSVLFITHDLGIISDISDRVAVMYAGKIVEIGNTADILSNPLHPYTKGLINSIPDIDTKKDRLQTIRGNVPTIQEMDTLQGCQFAPRCDYKIEICDKQSPELLSVEDEKRSCACFLISNKGVV